MINVFKYYHIQNLKDRLKELEDKMLNEKCKITRLDLQELEGLANEIQWYSYKLNCKN